MCEHRPGDDVPPSTLAHPYGTLSRRRALGLGAATVAAAVLAPGRVAGADARPGAAGPGPAPPRGPVRPRRAQASGAVVDALRPEIHPRSDWAGDLGVNGELQAEEEVLFLLVHHTASTNSYAPDQVAEQIRGFHQFHTGPDKGWPDVAYNFFVDRYGGVWEGRSGSLAGPVRGDATGGSQGHALLCSLIGDFTTEPMTAEQQASLVATLAWLAETYGVDTAPEAEVTVTSRGSNRWPAGTQVRTSTIAGHRDMSLTSCPGDAVYPLLASEIPTQVTELRAAAASELGAAEATADTEPPASTAATDAPTTVAPTEPEVTSPPSAEGPTSPESGAGDRDDEGGGLSGTTALVGGVALGVAAAGAAAVATGRGDRNRGA